MYLYVAHGSTDHGLPISIQINWDIEGPVIVIVIIDNNFIEDDKWVQYLRDLQEQIEKHGKGSRLLPIAFESGVLDNLNLDQQALRWDEWDPAREKRTQRLIRELAYEFSRTLRHYLHLLNTDDGEIGIEQDLAKIQVFLSHTKQDGKGKEIAETMRNWLHQNSNLASFMDIYDIPSGFSFSEVIQSHIEKSVFLAIYTDQYSSREWCRREVIDAKQKGVPMIVVDCLQTGYERSFPYLGNVPVIRMNPIAQDRIAEIAGQLLDEVLVNFLWRCRVELIPEKSSDMIFMPRAPELISLVTLETKQKRSNIVIHPDPPLGQEEMDLFNLIWGDLQIQTMSQWLTEENI